MIYSFDLCIYLIKVLSSARSHTKARQQHMPS